MIIYNYAPFQAVIIFVFFALIQKSGSQVLEQKG